VHLKDTFDITLGGQTRFYSSAEEALVDLGHTTDLHDPAEHVRAVSAVLSAKFIPPNMMKRLLDTGDTPISARSERGGPPDTLVGRLLTQLRTELRAEMKRILKQHRSPHRS